MIDDETLFAWLDGELAGDEAAHIEAAVADDPVLARKAAEHRALRDGLRAAFDPVAEAAVPPPLLRAVAKPSADVIDLASVRAARATPPQERRQRIGWAAVAAALVLGLSAGYALDGTPAGPAVQRDGRMMASAPVARALDQQLASAGTAPGAVQVRLTFRDSGGAVCRSFTTSAASGVACRENEGWAMRALFARQPEAGGSYRTAGSSDPAVAYVGTIIAGDPFDAAGEARAKAAGWVVR